MRGYSVHLFFHLLAALLGAAAGVAAGLWWTDVAPVGLWVAIGALLVGVLVLVVQSLYLPDARPSASRPARAAARSSTPDRAAPRNHGATRVRNTRSPTGTSPELEPAAAPEPPRRGEHRAPTRRI